MGLSRLNNFLKSTSGTVLYVDPSSIDSTDSIENQGNSLTRPFKTIQRALIEAARFSYQRGLDNDRFNKTTIVLYPGEHLVDNRPGYIPDGSNNFRTRSGAQVDDLVPFDLVTNFDLTTNNNALYKLNSVHGGVIIPRGTSIVGMDLRKTKIRPTYVPNPVNDNIERSAVFRVTGGCYLWQFSVLDANPNSVCYKDYTTNIFVPNFSHHKLTAFEYADGVNGVNIDDDFQTYSTTRTDLDMYYEKVGIVYGQSSGRPIEPDYPASTLDIQTVVDEYRIVGSRGDEVGISSIRAGDGITSDLIITVNLTEPLDGLDVDTPIKISGVNSAGYDGNYVVSEVVTSGTEIQIQYQVQNAPADPLPNVAGATLNIVVDTVTSASPYIFNISLRSVYGMCGLLADGDKAAGFKSMVVAQFTGIGLQKDESAFVKYDSSLGIYQDSTVLQNLSSDSLARFKPEYENFHIKATNNAFLQLVSIFAIGYAKHFVAESGGDLSITNSNSNFGAKSLVSSGFRKEAFSRDDTGYITHIIPPKHIESVEGSIEFVALDVEKVVGVASTNRLYLYNQLNEDTPPLHVIDGYRIGAKENDELYVEISQSGVTTQYSARIIMPNTEYTALEKSSEKVFSVGRSSIGINSISSDIFTLTSNHSLLSGESIRIFSEDGSLPGGLESNQLYYAITTDIDVTLANDQIKVAQSFNDAVTDNPITVNNSGGILSIVSRVSDKTSGQYGHPVQWDGSQWYVNVATAASENSIYPALIGIGTTGLGEATSRTYIKRKTDSRSLSDTVYSFRYVIPKDSVTVARPPLDAFVLEESNNVVGLGLTEIQKYFDPTNSSTLTNSNELKNPRFIANADWNSNVANIITELPHGLNVGSEVEVINIQSSNNPTGIANSSFNGTFVVTGISSTKQFSYSLDSDPGSFTNDTSTRNTSLPSFKRKKTKETFQIYRTKEVQKYVPNKQDGIYHLIVTNCSNKPSVSPFENLRFSQPIQNLYPQSNRDNPNSDPNPSVSYAIPEPIGQVVIDNPQHSITKETAQKFLIDFSVGFGLTDIRSNATGTSHTFYTTLDHGLAGITSVSIVDGGLAYGSGSAGNAYNARLVGFAGSTTGENATAVVTFDASGTITNVKIMDGGSAYGIGNTLTIAGIATTTGFSQAVVQVTNISDNIGDVIQLDGITPNANNEYNTLYKITGITTGLINEFEVESSVSINNPTQVGLGLTATESSNSKITGRSLGITTFTYLPVSGIATFTFPGPHGFKVDNKLRVGGADNNFFNGDFIVKQVNSLSSLTIDVGLGETSSVSAGGSITVYRYGLSSNGGDTTDTNENISGRLHYEYAGITTTLNSALLSTDSDSTPIYITGADVLGFKLGDYILIDSEIFRIKSDVTGDAIQVFRSLFGTSRETHVLNSVIRKIRVLPIELRRNSIIRASGHTFEYLGYGPGNYSTSLPERQDRIISPQEELIAQNSRLDGGVSIFTAMNSDGDFYTGNKKVNSATGQEEVFDAPIPTVTGEEIDTGNVSVGFDVLTPLEASITRSLRVEGGVDGSLISEFDGPVIFNNKITSNSSQGIEASSIYIQGDANVSRKFSVVNSKPTLAGNYGDVVTNSTPSTGDYIGWTYTAENEWIPFGYVGQIEYGVGISSNGSYVGFATLVDFQTDGIILTADRTDSGVTTVRFDANPKLGISSGPLNDFVGLATQINFVGYGITLTTDFNEIAGVATVTVDTSGLIGLGGSFPGLPDRSLQYNDNGRFFGVPIFTYNTSENHLRVGGSSTLALFKVTQSGTGDCFVVEDQDGDASPFVITNNGSVGIGISVPTAAIDVYTTNQTALNITSLSGSGNVVVVNDTSSDSTPFIIDVNGNVGIKTITAREALDVTGTVRIEGNAHLIGSEFRFYESNLTNYVGFKVGSVSSDLLFTLPTSYGSSGQVLYTNGSGTLGWQTVSRETTSAGSGIAISKSTDGSGNVTATITNSGVRSLTAGSNITLSGSTGSVTITANVPTATNPFLFNTKGFSMPL